MLTRDLARVARTTRYPLGAFQFVQRALDFTVKRAHGELDEDIPLDDDLIRSRHVDGRMLCYGLRDLAIQEFGLLARTVLRSWNIHSCEDFGQIVFAMVEGGLMQKTDHDSPDDFHDVFSFAEAFSTDVVLNHASA